MADPTRQQAARPIAAAPFARRGYFACVVDEDPRFHLDALRWFAALTEVAGVAPDDLFVHVVGSMSSEALAFVKSKGVTVRGVERFDPGSPHCNKISGALRMAEDHKDGVVVLCDTDVAVLEDPRGIHLDPRSVAGKVVDAPVPPLEVLERIFGAAGLTTPPPVRLPWGPGEWTVAGNNNGGLYLVPGALLPMVAEAWAQWARWLLDRAELLEAWVVHVDQVSMALALSFEGVVSLPLDVRWNTPIHDATRIPDDPSVPAVVHYHQEVEPSGELRRTGKAAIDERIDVLNTAIRGVWAEAGPGATTAAGPPHEADGALRATIATLMDALGADAVFEVVSEVPVHEADVVVRAAPLPDDVEELKVAVEILWRSARRAVVVRTGDSDPLSPLRRAAPESEIYPLSGGRGSLTTVVLLVPPAPRHPRDVVPATLDPVLPRHPDPLTLLLIRLHALRSTGFYPDHAPRVWEYPVIAGLVAANLPAGSRLLDVGAGVTPLAPFLSNRGYLVETVDPSDILRPWPPQPDWNEWGFLDYAAVGLAQRSWNCMLDQLPRTPPFDGIYSVSVIEHMPAAARRALLADISARVRPGGLVALTIDLVPGTDDLWNLNLGVVVEQRSDHGTLPDVVEECAAVGLDLLGTEVVRDWGDSRVDVALFVLRRGGTTGSRRWRDVGRRAASRVRRTRR